MKQIIVGSNAFFKKFKDFEPHDLDTLELIDNPTKFKINRQIRLNGNCILQWKRMSAREFVDYHKNCKAGLFIGKFLVPEFIKEIDLTIDLLKELEFMISLLDDKHLYEKVIYDAYIKNNDFILTEEQLLEAYKIYKKFRK